MDSIYWIPQESAIDA